MKSSKSPTMQSFIVFYSSFIFKDQRVLKPSPGPAAFQTDTSAVTLLATGGETSAALQEDIVITIAQGRRFHFPKSEYFTHYFINLFMFCMTSPGKTPEKTLPKPAVCQKGPEKAGMFDGMYPIRFIESTPVRANLRVRLPSVTSPP